MVTQYAYIDIVVLDGIRERFARGDALVVLTSDLDAVIWANGPGAALFGAESLEDFLGSTPAIPATEARQIRSAAARGGTVHVRRSRGVTSTLIPLVVAPVALPGGEDGLLVRAEAAGEQGVFDHVIDGFESADTHLALLAGDGTVRDATTRFDALGISDDERRALVDEVRNEADRLVKRPVASERGRYPAAIARLGDGPDALHLLMVVEDMADDEPAGIAATDEAPAPAAGDRTPHRRDASDDDTDSWYYGSNSRVAFGRRPSPPQQAASDNGRPETPAPASPDAPEEVTGFQYDAASKPVRFVWKTDAEGRFIEISDEFARAVGPNAANVIGRRFDDVSNVFGLDPENEIWGLLTRRDTWSGRAVFWPVQGTELKVPVDLAALPVYGRDREFEGFRGFGVARMADAIRDDEAIGMTLAPVNSEPGPEMIESEPAKPAAIEPDTSGGKVVKLEELRAREKTRSGLSSSEAAAFREIGTRLKAGSKDETDEVGEEPGETDVPQTVEAAEAVDSGGTETGGADRDLAVDTETVPAGKPSLDAGALDRLPLAMLIHHGDTLLYANEALLEITGYESLADLEQAGGLGALFADDEDDTGERHMRLVTASGERVDTTAHLQSIKWDGASALLMSLKPATDAAGGDVETEAGSAAADSAVRELQSILDTATDGVVILDGDGRIRSLNGSAQALFGHDPDAVTGEHITTLFAIESHRQVNDYLSGLAGSGVASLLNDGRELIAKEAMGRFIPVFMTMGVLPESGGYCAVLRDITQFKRTEQELERAKTEAERSSEQKSAFLARVSHEVRTPLNAIIGFSELMLAETYGPVGNQRYKDYLKDINMSGSHVLQLINDLLDISKIEAGQMELDFTATDLNQTVEECVSIMQPAANRERVIVRTSLSPDLPEVVADERSMRQIMLNLLSNAIRFTPAGGQIIVSTVYEPSGDVALKVRDTGVGMSTAELDQALKPFKQVSSAHRRRGDGTGLGLPLTKAMAEANRADFTISSRPAEGTVVTITFPPTRVLAE